MKYVTAIALILLGLVWLFFSVPDRPAGETRALSHAIEFEYKLHEWMMAKEAEGKLDESDIREVFTESGAIKFGGENPDEDFKSMVKGIASDSILPSTPGVLAIIIGVLGLLPRPRQNKSEMPTA